MSLDDWWDDAVLVRILVPRPWSLDWAEGVVAGRRTNWGNAPICDRFEESRLGCRGIALYIISELCSGH
jgi:hypothetical protein